MSRLTRDGTAEPSRETKFSGTNGDNREILFFPVQLTKSKIGNYSDDPYSAICDDHTYIHTLLPCKLKPASIYIIFAACAQSTTTILYSTVIWCCNGITLITLHDTFL